MAARPAIQKVSAGAVGACAVVLALLAVACTSGDEGGAPQAGSTRGSPRTTQGVSGDPPALPRSATGRGAIALGDRVYEFEITSCTPSAATDAPESARVLFELEGKGTVREGVEFTVSVRRFETKATASTVTDTITYRDSARIYQAQRIEVDGAVTDQRDPAAATPLLVIDGRHVVASGVFSPPGSGVEEGGLLAGRLDATC